MIAARRAADRGVTSPGWRDSRRPFSFAGYHDPDHMGFAPLRLVNEDTARAGRERFS